MTDREEKLYRLAQKKVKKKKGFYKHLQAFVFVNLALLLVCLTDQGHYDAYPVPIFWGIGLAFHYVSVFGMPGGKLTDEWEERELEKEFDKLRNRSASSSKPTTSVRSEELDLDEHLELRQKQPQRNYDDRDFV